jgi:hypothetical protein
MLLPGAARVAAKSGINLHLDGGILFPLALFTGGK